MANIFAQTQDKFRIKNADLVQATGFSSAYVSEIRSGKASPSFDGMTRWLDGAEQLSPGARKYFCELLAGKSLETKIDAMDSTELAGLLLAIADKLQNGKRPAVSELISA